MLIPSKCTLCKTNRIYKDGVCEKCVPVLYRLFRYFRPQFCYHELKSFESVLVTISTNDLILLFGAKYKIPWFIRKCSLPVTRVKSSLRIVYDICSELVEMLPEVCNHQGTVCKSCQPICIEFLKVFAPKPSFLHTTNSGVSLVFCSPQLVLKSFLVSRYRHGKFVRTDFRVSQDQFDIPFSNLPEMVRTVCDLCLKKATFYYECLKRYFRC